MLLLFRMKSLSQLTTQLESRLDDNSGTSVNLRQPSMVSSPAASVASAVLTRQTQAMRESLETEMLKKKSKSHYD